MAEEKVKLPRSSFEELCRIIKAYGHQKEAVSLKIIADTAALSRQVVSANNKFLLGIGIIEGGNNKTASNKGRKLASALDLNMPDEIRTHWREIIKSSDFLSRILSAVRIRKGMDESTLQAHIAYSAGEPNKGFVMTGARAVIDMLRAAELLREEDGKLISVDIRNVDSDESFDKPIVSNSQESVNNILQKEIELPASCNSTMVLTISVNLDCKPSDLDGLGIKIKNMINEMSEIDSKTSENSSSESHE